MKVSPLRGQRAGRADSDFVVVEWADQGETSPERPIAPLHVHHLDDECWYVLEGTLGFRLGDEELEAGVGDAVFVPRGTPHTYWNARAQPARYVLVMTRRIADLIEALHSGPGLDYAAIFREHESQLL
jgi:mannose-6-phosphate isomerase-like protein (cupin superfamily)